MHRGPGWVGFTHGPMAYMRIAGPLSRDAVDGTRRLQLEALAARPTGMAFLLDAAGDTPLPDAQVRAYAAEMAARHSAGLVVHVTLLEEAGFRASALRSALTGIFFLARSPYPRHVVASLPEARDRIARVLGDDAAPLWTLQADLAELRRALAG